MNSVSKIKPSKLVWFFIFLFFIILGFNFTPLESHHRGFFLTGFTFGKTMEELIREKRDEMDKLQQQISEYKEKIQQTQQQSKTLEGEITIFTSKIKRTELELRQTQLAIEETDIGIQENTASMKETELKKEQVQSSMKESLKLVYEQDSQSLLELFLQGESLSSIFGEIYEIQGVQARLEVNLDELRQLKEQLDKEQEELEAKKEDLDSLKTLQYRQRLSLQSERGQQQNLLKETRGQESLYQEMLKKTEKTIGDIRRQLYTLEGTGVSLGLAKALEYASYASSKTGVRPAFLLAVLKVESNWNGNVGTGNWKEDMYDCYVRLGKRSRAEKEKEAFFTITAELGLDPNTMPVSAEPAYGCGGAMGAAQFMPTTWMAYKDRGAALLGHAPSPWDVKDAFTVAGIKLGDGGANIQTYDAEWKAAMVYFAGSNWNKSQYRFYGDSVMEIASAIQAQLSQLN